MSMEIVDVFYLAIAISALFISAAAWYIAFPLVRTLRSLKKTIEIIREVVDDFNNLRNILNFLPRFFKKRKDEEVK